MGLFREHLPLIKDGVTVTERWHSWLGQERLRRLAWAVYVGSVLYAVLRDR